ncbi:DoxX family protein [Nocardia inohanensis]|uniref:DoxX family protein n=1 Tax=Nocardia inohanensis TaxID=209246 RepID=UPI00082BB857|nr:hypothetical protein [Nocardia inohanensis]
MTTITPPGRGRALLLAAGMLGAGATHFAAPKFYDALIPPELPGEPRTYTYVSGAAELGIGALIAVPRTRRLGARLAMLLLIIVFPGNVQMARDWLTSNRPLPLKAGALLRLPLQIPMITTARKVARAA